VAQFEPVRHPLKLVAHFKQNAPLIRIPCIAYFLVVHYILLEIDVEKGVVTVLDSRRKDRNEYAEITKLLAK